MVANCLTPEQGDSEEQQNPSSIEKDETDGPQSYKDISSTSSEAVQQEEPALLPQAAARQ